jgi:hypothetical protein
MIANHSDKKYDIMLGSRNVSFNVKAGICSNA